MNDHENSRLDPQNPSSTVNDEGLLLPSATSADKWHDEPSDTSYYSSATDGESYSGHSDGGGGGRNRHRRAERTRNRQRERRHLEAGQQRQQDGGDDDQERTGESETGEEKTSYSEPIASGGASERGVEVGFSSIPLPTTITARG